MSFITPASVAGSKSKRPALTDVMPTPATPATPRGPTRGALSRAPSGAELPERRTGDASASELELLPVALTLGKAAEMSRDREPQMVQREDTSREGPTAEPGKELAMLEDLERVLAEEVRAGGHSASWHYLLQELALTRQALQGRSLKGEAEPPGGRGLLDSVDFSAMPERGLGLASGASSVPGREVAEVSEDSEPEEPTQVAEILAEAARAGNDAEA
ncbi:pntB, partial [Symbiodinium necroappetens]